MSCIQKAATLEKLKRYSYGATIDYISGKYDNLYNADEVRSTLEEYVKLLDYSSQKTKLLTTAFGNQDHAKDLNELTRELTGGLFDDFDKMVRESRPGYLTYVKDQMNDKYKMLMSVSNGMPDILTRSEFTSDFINTGRFYYQYYNKQNTQLLKFIPIPVQAALVRSKIFYGSYIQAFRAVPEAGNTYEKFQYLTNSTPNLMHMLHSGLEKIRNDHDNLILPTSKAKIGSSDLVQWVRYLDPGHVHNFDNSQVSRTEIAQRIISEQRGILNKKMTDAGISDPDDMYAVMKELYSLREDINVWDYGFKEGMGAMDKKGYANSTSLDSAVPTKFGAAPPLLRVIYRQAQSVIDIIDKIDPSILPEPLKKFRTLFDQTQSTEEQFNPRQSYMPMATDSGLKDDEYQKLNDKTFSLLYQNTNIFEERTNMLNTDADVDVLSALSNNLKSIQHLFTTTAEYATSLAVRTTIEKGKDVLLSNNEYAYRSLDHWSKVIENTYTTTQTKMNRFNRAYKHYLQAMTSAAAGLILTAGGPKNIWAGEVFRSASINPFEHSRMKRSYNTALKGGGIDGDIARWVEEEYSKYKTLEKLSSELQKESLDAYQDGMSKSAEFFESKLPEIISKVGEASANRLFGLINAKLLNFNNSENYLLQSAKYYAYEKLKVAAKQYSDMKQVPIQTALEVVGKECSNNIFMTTKEMIGEYSKYAKPFWSWKFLRDSDNFWQTTGGAVLVMTGMFKSVLSNNVDLLTKVSTAPGKSVGNAKSGSGGIELATYMALSTLLEEFTEFGLSNYGVMSTNPSEEVYNNLMATKALAAVLTNQPVSQKQAERIDKIFKQHFGLFFGTFADFKIKGHENEYMFDGNGDVTLSFRSPFDSTGKMMSAIGTGVMDLIDPKFSDKDPDELRRIAKENMRNPFILLNYSNDYLTYGVDLLAFAGNMSEYWRTGEDEFRQKAGDKLIGSVLRYSNASFQVPPKDFNYSSYNDVNLLSNHFSMLKTLRYNSYKAAKDSRQENFANERKEKAAYYVVNKPNRLKKAYLHNTQYFDEYMDHFQQLLDDINHDRDLIDDGQQI